MNYKGYLITPYEPFPTLYSVATEGRGGSVPKVLSGLFTTPALAAEAIDEYVTSQEEKPRVRKTNSKE